MNSLEAWLADEAATVAWGERFGQALEPGLTVYLEGTLGAGKTTFTRGVMQGLGHSGTVKSPTYTLVEPYQTGRGVVYHFDLYRLGEPLELEYLGIRDYFSKDSMALIEWPQRGTGVLPRADITITMTVSGTGRLLALAASSDAGEAMRRRLLTATEE